MPTRRLETGRTDLEVIVTAIRTTLPGELYALDLSNTHNTHSYSALAHCVPVQNLPRCTDTFNFPICSLLYSILYVYFNIKLAPHSDNRPSC